MFDCYGRRSRRQLNDMEAVHNTGPYRCMQTSAHQFGHGLADGYIAALGIRLHLGNEIIVQGECSSHGNYDVIVYGVMSRTNREHHSAAAHIGRNKSRALRLPKKENLQPGPAPGALTIHSIRAPIAPSRSGSGEVSLYQRSRRSRRCCPGQRVRLPCWV